MEEQLPKLGEGISDIGAGVFFAALAVSVAWHHIARMRWRSPLDELARLDEAEKAGLLSEAEHKRLRKKVLERF